MKVNVALIQFRPLLCQPEQNMNAIARLMDEATGANLIVLPELASTGYNFSDKEEAFRYAEEPSKSNYVRFLIDKASEMKAVIVSGVCEREGDNLYNSAVTVDGQGIRAKYRKIHLFMNEKDIFQPGEGDLPVEDIGGIRVGMTICFDYLFPEIWRMQAMNGADIICHPSNLLTRNAHRCVPGLALMNRIFILTANRTGEERGLVFNGQSLITDPAGEIVARAAAGHEQVIRAELDIEMARNKWVTPRNHAFTDRRPALYTP